jgi:stage III sporulation protein SpoIIIAA
MVATAHGESIHSLIQNPEINDLVGGIDKHTLGDAEAKKRSQTSKTAFKKEVIDI